MTTPRPDIPRENFIQHVDRDSGCILPLKQTTVKKYFKLWLYIFCIHYTAVRIRFVKSAGWRIAQTSREGNISLGSAKFLHAGFNKGNRFLRRSSSKESAFAYFGPWQDILPDLSTCYHYISRFQSSCKINPSGSSAQKDSLISCYSSSVTPWLLWTMCNHGWLG